MVAQNKLGKHGLDVDFCKMMSFQHKGFEIGNSGERARTVPNLNLFFHD